MNLGRPEALYAALLGWYDAHARDLPWRDVPAGGRDPYRTLLSEMLLQQTQVSRGALYFQNFISAFPSVGALAAAPLEAVLKLWEGAGYYARARNLHRAAGLIADHGFPDSLEGWMALPGIGRYSAGAILSLSRDLAVPVVDGNVRRVLARLFLVPQPGEAWLWNTASSLLPEARPGAWNEALIELGATVCLPRAPRCGACPLRAHCLAHSEARVDEVPAAKLPPRVLEVRAVALLAHHEGTVLLEQRPKRGLLGGLYGVPLEPIQTRREAALEVLLARFSLKENGAWAGQVAHKMTHRQIHLEVYALPLAAGDGLPLELPDRVALSKLDRKVLALRSGQDADAPQSALF